MIPGLGGRGPSSQGPVVAVRLRKILLVDDALPVRRKLEEILHRTGLPVSQLRTATSVEEALEAFAKENPALVFTELIGEEPASGLEMIFEMLDLDPHVKIVLLTAESPDSPLVRQAVKRGIFAVVQKPLRHDKIRQVVSELEAEEGGVERFR